MMHNTTLIHNTSLIPQPPFHVIVTHIQQPRFLSVQYVKKHLNFHI